MVDEKWFLELDRRKLIKLYVGIEDIWNFRAGLTPVEIKLFARKHYYISKST